MKTRVMRARFDQTRVVRVTSRRPLFYRDGANENLDRPAHVRAGSGIATFEGRLWIVQDDAAFLAHLDGLEGHVRALPLEPLEDGLRLHDSSRGNKKLKLDLELVVALPDRLLAFGSGSTARRERVVELQNGCACLIDGGPLYRAMRACRAFSGSELNVEGAVVEGDDVVFFQRGNGAPRDGHEPVNATARVALADLFTNPELRDVQRWELEPLRGARLGFTDATVWDGRLLFAAAAEDSPDAVDDGEVAGSALGFALAGDDEGVLIRVEGRDKLEGITVHEGKLVGVIDADTPDQPADLVTLEIGP